MSSGERSCATKPCPLEALDDARMSLCNVDCPHYAWDGRTPPDSKPSTHGQNYPRDFDQEDGRPVGDAAVPQRRKHAKIGRNDRCPCGSGLKFKRCCGK